MISERALTKSDRRALSECAERLRLSPEEAIRRAVSKLHQSLFRDDAGMVPARDIPSVGMSDKANTDPVPEESEATNDAVQGGIGGMF